MRQQIIYKCLVLWILLGGSIGQLLAQGYEPLPPEPGQLFVSLISSPENRASFEQTSSTGMYLAGDKVTVKVNPEKDYEFVAWLQNDQEVSTTAEYTFTITGTTRLVAKLRFNPESNPDEPGSGYYNVIAKAKPSEGGWIEQSGRGIYKSESEVKLTAYTYSGYVFDHWEMQGKVVSKEPEYKLQMPSKNVYLTAIYKWDPASPSEPSSGNGELHLVKSDDEAGYISQNGSGIYPLGTLVHLEASPSMGYSFIGWYEDDNLLSTSISYVYQIRKKRATVEARFKVDQSGGGIIKVEVDPSDGKPHGSVSVEGLVIPGQHIVVSADPKEGYAFEGWYVNGILIEDAEMDFSLLVEKNLTSLVAKFREIPFSLEMEGSLENWAMVSRLRGNVAHLSAQKVQNYTFMGWYKGETLLSMDLEYDFNISGLRSSLPVIKAKYVKSLVSNEIISSFDGVEISMRDGYLYITSSIFVKQVDVYTFSGRLLKQFTNVDPSSTKITYIPNVPILVRMEDGTGNVSVFKLR